MKRWIAFLIVFCISADCDSFGQGNRKEKFSVQLPQEWKRKPKLLLQLVKIITSHIPQLENLAECLNCKATYYVKFFVSPPTVENIYSHPASSYEFTTLFHFYAYMDVADSTGATFHRLILNDTSTVHSFNYKFFGKGSTIPPVQNTIAQLKDNALPALENGQRTININLDERIQNLNAISKQFDSNQFNKIDRTKLIPPEPYLWSKVRDIIMDYQFDDLDQTKH